MRYLLTFLLLLLAVPAFAQNPTAVSFTPSADHATVVAGTAILTRYDEVIKKQSDSSVVATKDCGKPALAATLTCALPSGLPQNVSLTATIVAVGPGGSTPSVPSDPFVASVGAPAAPGKPTLQ
jgi:hypothetical protein